MDLGDFAQVPLVKAKSTEAIDEVYLPLANLPPSKSILLRSPGGLGSSLPLNSQVHLSISQVRSDFGLYNGYINRVLDVFTKKLNSMFS